MRNIEVRVSLVNGHSHTCVLAQNSPILHDLYTGLANARVPNHAGTLIQLPAKNGQAAFSFMSTSVLSVTTEPPVLINVDGGTLRGGVASTLAPAVRDRFVRIDDFLTPAENEDLLRFAIEQEANYETSTVYHEKESSKDENVRKSKVLFTIGKTQWKPLFVERLKLHLPHLLDTLNVPAFEIGDFEIQLTASNDGDFFKRHADTDRSNEAIASRQLTFVYYLNRSPKPYSGGDILFYGENSGGLGDRGADVVAVSPANNSLISFASDRWHEVELVRCLSGEFADSRFTVNGWLRSRAEIEPNIHHNE